ncbi:type IV-A pilus assembly ATPase PilB [Colwellia sp. 4_MG-2023]|jgi:type IV pilus assembly protein PilB|uniref:type IV-A pilus assembly ATPase PilB n=1 Tax=unclassified Colwellia TaxID=196834 RepID=UPI001C07FD48|nr:MULTISPECIES: type IV-A pilus assembly ATPase PilB [unclassified Colwellia]MBU2926222.1 type IV-A pilus assembly ATPase PilB [Colwellia sp. C2M11]MDO6487278.1 type IV-A pilus assembly ATPase PilB [Colwellia sp. 6_MG-2023]MDO6507193.1 type IV-A pilus assembly ATPase PilB [Colwellia sp. 5_MG-2023]MDO6556029.1 type IV-A pilus assembly ATPase PilB [Colwellia sp. 4_MG-2023]MDO6652356.1 type IV-A pilus assembly ATPase PilB [Colwellia sp. 3_MG-2023]
MKGNHQQSSVLSALSTEHLIPLTNVDDIFNDFTGKDKPFIRYLVEDKKIDSKKIAAILSYKFGYPYIQLSNFDTTLVPDGVRNEKLITKHNALPLFLRGKVLFVAMSDPTDLDALEEIQFNTGYSTELILTDELGLQACIEKVLEDEGGSLNITDIDSNELSGIDVQEDQSDDDPVSTGEDDAPIVVFINKILLDAIKKGASDLHFEPYEKSFRIRFRIDGILTEIARPPVSLSSRMSARLKVMAKLDIAERRVPQDGRIKLSLSKKKSIDFRVSTLPTMWGEKIVMRILDSSSAMLGIDMLGYEPAQKKIYMEALEQPQGMILVTGPTGSGKTVSLYTGLNILNTAERNISTAEDPVEINLEGINQVQINNRAGLTFPSALRSFLRQDPDIVMVGEIRDLETAEIAIKAAQTGHLVLSTLHTNSAAETLTRLLNMGVPAYNVASSVTTIIAQRLARRLCSQCKTHEVLSEAQLAEQGFPIDKLSEIKLFKPVGCEHCTGGYKGRVGIYEVIKISPEIASIIMEGGNSLDIAEQCQKEGYNNLRQSGLEKAMDGMTSLKEINRVTSS